MAEDKHLLRESRVFFWTAGVFAGVYLGMRYGVPWLAVLVGASQVPAPVPGFALVIYLSCTALGALVYASSDERRWQHFVSPVVRLFAVSREGRRRSQLLVLGLLPVLAGWAAWQRVIPRTQTAAGLRVQHPTLPGQYSELRNPLRELPEDQRRAAEQEGVVLYQKNCRPCHGTLADGDGPLARGLRLRPVNFTDPGTIATVVEPYVFWRIKEGGVGLPGTATPWNSAMPAWKDQLTEDQIWRIIMAEYATAGKEPRQPEGAKP